MDGRAQKPMNETSFFNRIIPSVVARRRVKSAGMPAREDAMDAANSLSEIAMVGCVGLGAYGTYTEASVWPLSLATIFTLSFYQAKQRVKMGSRRMQLPFVLVLVIMSFALHMVYLPAGLCCFFALMLCKNEILFPDAQPGPPPRRPPKTGDKAL